MFDVPLEFPQLGCMSPARPTTPLIAWPCESDLSGNIAGNDARGQATDKIRHRAALTRVVCWPQNASIEEIYVIPRMGSDEDVTRPIASPGRSRRELGTTSGQKRAAKASNRVATTRVHLTAVGSGRNSNISSLGCPRKYWKNPLASRRTRPRRAPDFLTSNWKSRSSVGHSRNSISIVVRAHDGTRTAVTKQTGKSD